MKYFQLFVLETGNFSGGLHINNTLSYFNMMEYL